MNTQCVKGAKLASQLLHNAAAHAVKGCARILQAIPSAPACEPFRRWRRRSGAQSLQGSGLPKCQGIRKPIITRSGFGPDMANGICSRNASTPVVGISAGATWCFHTNQRGPYLRRTLVTFAEVKPLRRNPPVHDFLQPTMGWKREAVT